MARLPLSIAKLMGVKTEVDRELELKMEEDMEERRLSKIGKIIEAYNDDIISHITNLISIKSINGEIGACEEALDYVIKLGNEFGMKTGITPERDAGFIEIGQGSEELGILVHVDVVGPGDLNEWATPPFEATIKDGYIYGRGIVDDKGPVIMSLYAMKALLEEGTLINKRVRLVVGTAEESSWTDMDHYKNIFALPDYGFSPDGEFPVYNIEKGYADVEVSFKDEKSLGFLKISAGESPNTIPGKAIIEHLDGTLHEYMGRSVHSSEPWAGENAILLLAQGEKKYNKQSRFRFLDFLIENFMHGYGLNLGIDDGLSVYQGTFVGETVASPTIMKLTKHELFLNINVRTKYGTTESMVNSAFEKVAEKYGFSFRIKEMMEGMMVNEELPVLTHMNRLYEKSGRKGGFYVANGTSYAKAMKNFVCWGPVFPEEPSCAHEENERLSIIKMVEATKLYASFLAVTTR